MSHQPPLPQLDAATISFPTDRITLGDMRKHQPSLFSSDALLESSKLDQIQALATLHVELSLAERAFRSASLKPPPRSRQTHTKPVDHTAANAPLPFLPVSNQRLGPAQKKGAVS